MKLDTFLKETPVYIINLADSISRKEHIQEQFKSYKYLNFIEAVDGRQAEFFATNYNVTYNDCGKKYSTGLIAVICSHIRAIYTSYHNNDEYAIILEDDAWTDLIEPCQFTISDICKIDDEWEVIQLFYSQEDIIKKNFEDFKQNGLKLIPRTNNLSGTCYLINRKGMHKFLTSVAEYDGVNTFKLKYPIIDPEYVVFGHIRSYIINRMIFYYYFETMTFDNYFITGTNPNAKKNCQPIHYKIALLLRQLYS